MRMAILGGVAKGFPLKSPTRRETRPTPVLLRRKFFDYHGDWEGRHFVDLCSGSGAVGLEAWSRGAESVELVERSADVLKILQKNVKKISVSYKEEFCLRPIEIVFSSVESYIKKGLGKKQRCRFFDPPYRKKELYEKVIEKIVTSTSAEEELWVQSEIAAKLSIGWESIKTFRQGRNQLCCYKGLVL